MNKKQLWSIGAVFALFITTKMLDFGQEMVEHNTKLEVIGSLDSLPVTWSDDQAEYLAHSPYIANLHFAHEYLPLGDKQVENKMRQHLNDYSFDRVRSHRMHELAETALPIVEEILLSYGIPADFKYIPMVESGFTKNTTSHKGASGYWQFMPATARAYGLTVNEEVDERQDLIKSTHAAARYIKALNQEFDNWVLTAAAYNVGSGSLRRAINSQAEDNYFKLKLNRETGSYVYRLISAKEVIENPHRHGYEVAERRQLTARALSEDPRSPFPGTHLY